MKVKYECEECGKIFEEAEECLWHENIHRVNEKLNQHPNCVTCPTCKGLGYYTTDGYNRYTCNTCKGKQIVLFKKVPNKTINTPTEE